MQSPTRMARGVGPVEVRCAPGVTESAVGATDAAPTVGEAGGAVAEAVDRHGWRAKAGMHGPHGAARGAAARRRAPLEAEARQSGRVAWWSGPGTQATREPWVPRSWLVARRPRRVALDSPDVWAVGEGTVIGAGVGAKLAGCAREGQCAHHWGREQGQCCREIGRAWVRQLGPGESEGRVARRLFRMA